MCCHPCLYHSCIQSPIPQDTTYYVTILLLGGNPGSTWLRSVFHISGVPEFGFEFGDGALTNTEPCLTLFNTSFKLADCARAIKIGQPGHVCTLLTNMHTDHGLKHWTLEYILSIYWVHLPYLSSQWRNPNVVDLCGYCGPQLSFNFWHFWH